MPGARSRKESRKILDPIRPGLLRVEDIRAAVKAVAAEEAASRKAKQSSSTGHDLSKSLS